jgi:hypothetical protein
MLLRTTIREIKHTKPSWMEFMVPTHDSTLVEYPKEKRADVYRYMVALMGGAWPQLNGLRVGLEVKVGSSLGNMREYSMPVAA